LRKSVIRLKDIAQACHVSISTVSRALRGDPQIAEETRLRIQAEARRQQYKIDKSRAVKEREPAGRGYEDSSGLRRLVVLMHGENIRPFFAETLIEIAHIAARYRLTTEFVQARRVDTVAACFEKGMAAHPDAILFITWLDSDEIDVAVIRSCRVLVVLFNRHIPGISNAVTLDDFAAGVQMARYLYDLGHRRIAHLAGPENSSAVRERAWGLRSELERLGCYDPELFEQVQCSRYVESLQEGVNKFINMAAPATAIWAYNDAAAAVVLSAVHAAGLAVPDDISVAGYDFMAQVGDLNLTTFDYRFAAMGRVAVKMVTDLLMGDIAGPLRYCVVPTLVVGATTGPAKLS